MSESVERVERVERVESLPWELGERRAEQVLRLLMELGLFRALETGTHLRRRAASYELVDVFGFCVAYFASGCRSGFKEFARTVGSRAPELAAAFGRKKWMGQSSVSRALSACGDDAIAEVGKIVSSLWLKLVLPESLRSLGHRDAYGHLWSVVHHDGSLVGIRQRELPQGLDLPEPCRLGTRLGQPGYAGRKRADVLCQRGLTQHAGTGAWLALTVEPGSPTSVKMTQAAADAAAQHAALQPTTNEGGHPTVMVADGGGGGWQVIRATRTAGVHVLVRICSYDWFKDRHIRHQLGHGEWLQVPDSASGPQRSATEVGLWRTPGGSVLRVIATRFAVEDAQTKRAGAGVTLKSQHYELFATDLPADAWPVSDVVQLYYERCGQENAFAQLNRRYDLQRVFHFSSNGQCLVTLAALLVWNVELLLGANHVDSVELSHPELEPAPRADIRVEPPTDILQPEDDHESETQQGTEAPTPNYSAPGPESGDSPQDCDESAQLSNRKVVVDSARRSPHIPSNPTTESAHPTLKVGSLQEATTRTIQPFIDQRPGWKLRHDGLHCPQGHRIWTTPRVQADQRLTVRIRAPQAACVQCPLRHQCADGKPTGPKYRLDRILRAADDVRIDQPETTDARPFARSPILPGAQTPPHPTPGPYQCVMARLRIGTLLRLRDRYLPPPMRLVVELPRLRTPLPDVVAPTSALRQNRRKTYEQRIAWNALPPGTKVTRISYLITRSD